MEDWQRVGGRRGDKRERERNGLDSAYCEGVGVGRLHGVDDSGPWQNRQKS